MNMPGQVNEMMNTAQAIKQRVYQVIDGLPSESFEELSHFLDFLKFKYQVQQPRKVVALGGLWKNLDFDVTDAEVRALRQRVTAQLLNSLPHPTSLTLTSTELH